MTTAVSANPAVRIDGNLAKVTFDRFGLDAYRLFLQCKALPESQLSYDWQKDCYTLTTPARFATMLGTSIDLPPLDRLPFPTHLFDYQIFTLDLALASERFAVWWDTGLGKGLLILEWCRQVRHLAPGRVLIVEPLQVISQLIDEATRFYRDGLPVHHIKSREELIEWCTGEEPAIGIVNPEKFIPGVVPEMRYLAGVAWDESSILKSGGGVIKWNGIKSCRGIKYKLSCTAVPAPNDSMEYASQASFLEKLRTEGEILWTFFTRDKFGNWSVKPHAREAFYRFMASWSIYMQNPAHFGFGDILASLPPPDIREYTIPITPIQQELMFTYLTKTGKGMFTDQSMGVQERSKLSQLAKGFLYEKSETARRAIAVESLKPRFVADLVRADVADGRQVIVWTVFDEESSIVAEQLAGAPFVVATLDGSDSEEDRLATIAAFKAGRVQVLISKAVLLGKGLNFQNCRSMVFSGFDDSFEAMYQAIRRCYRFGQTETVRVHIPYVRELEGMIFDNVKAKEQRFMADVGQAEAHYRKVLSSQQLYADVELRSADE